MAGALRKTMVYLGLAEEDERYGSYDEAYEDDRVSEHTAAVTPLPSRPTSVASVVRPTGVNTPVRSNTLG